MKSQNLMREEHNRQVQHDIDTERSEVDHLKEMKEKFIPEITKLETRLEDINYEIRKIDIEMDCREVKIAVLSQRFWKDNDEQKHV